MNEFSRYYRLLWDAAHPPLEAACAAQIAEVDGPPPLGETNSGADRLHEKHRTVGLGAAAGRLMLKDDPALYRLLALKLEQLSMVAQAHAACGGNQAPILADGLGHKRPIYWPFVVHLHLTAFAKRFESLPASVWSRCEAVLTRLVEPMRVIEQCADRAPAPSTTAMVLWQGLCLCQQAMLAGRDADLEWLESAVHRIVTRPGPHGSLHPAPEEDGSVEDKIEHGLDGWIYRELTGLHALAHLALLRRNQLWAKRVREVALYHLERTQPDHVTAQPWGVFAFLWSPQTRIFAEQQIHDATAYAAHWPEPGSGATVGTGRLGVLAALLLADAAVCTGALGQPEGPGASVGVVRE